MLRKIQFMFDPSGSVLVEFAMVLPMLLALACGIAEFGYQLYGYELIESGLRDGARYLSHLNYPVGAINVTAAQQLAVYGQIGGTTKRVDWWNTSDVTVTFNAVANSTGTYRGASTIYVAHVGTSVTYTGLGLLSYLGLPSSMTLTFYHEERLTGT